MQQQITEIAHVKTLLFICTTFVLFPGFGYFEYFHYDMFQETHVCISVQYISGSTLASWVLVDIGQSLPKQLYQFLLPPAMQGSSGCSISLLILGNVSYFHFSHSGMQVVVSHSRFDFSSQMTKEFDLFHMFIGPWDIFLKTMYLVKVFYPFYYQIVCLFLTSFQNFLIYSGYKPFISFLCQEYHFPLCGLSFFIPVMVSFEYLDHTTTWAYLRCQLRVRGIQNGYWRRENMCDNMVLRSTV